MSLNVNPTLSEQLEENYNWYVTNGGTVDIDHKYGTVLMELGKNKSDYFPEAERLYFQGDDFNVLDDCPDDVSEEAWLVYMYM